MDETHKTFKVSIVRKLMAHEVQVIQAVLSINNEFVRIYGTRAEFMRHAECRAHVFTYKNAKNGINGMFDGADESYKQRDEKQKRMDHHDMGQ